MSSHASLDAAAQARKNRLAQLKSLKRKQPPNDDGDTTIPDASTDQTAADDESTPTVTQTYLSGRNYDAESRAPKLGFETAPSNSNGPTLEERAAVLADESVEQQAKDAVEEKPLDLFQLQPKKPNWDLKRDLQRKLDVLSVRTDNAIARLVRERIEAQQKAKGVESTDGQGGMEGAALVEAMHVREREEEEDERREKELDAEDGLA
jgi:coiled-coil domain-containing protein 12